MADKRKDWQKEIEELSLEELGKKESYAKYGTYNSSSVCIDCTLYCLVCQ